MLAVKRATTPSCSGIRLGRRHRRPDRGALHAHFVDSAICPVKGPFGLSSCRCFVMQVPYQRSRYDEVRNSLEPGRGSRGTRRPCGVGTGPSCRFCRTCGRSGAPRLLSEQASFCFHDLFELPIPPTVWSASSFCTSVRNDRPDSVYTCHVSASAGPTGAAVRLDGFKFEPSLPFVFMHCSSCCFTPAVWPPSPSWASVRDDSTRVCQVSA